MSVVRHAEPDDVEVFGERFGRECRKTRGARAVERLGETRAEELLREGAATPVGQVIEEVLAAPAPRADDA